MSPASDHRVLPDLELAWALHVERRMAFRRFVFRAVSTGVVAAAFVSILAVSAGYPYAAIAFALFTAALVARAIAVHRPASDAVELFEAMIGPAPRDPGRPSARIIFGPWTRPAPR